MSALRTPGDEDGLPPRMTLRVYTVNRAGRITSDSGTRGIEDAETWAVTDLGQEFPPCGCPRHRVMRPAR